MTTKTKIRTALKATLALGVTMQSVTAMEDCNSAICEQVRIHKFEIDLDPNAAKNVAKIDAGVCEINRDNTTNTVSVHFEGFPSAFMNTFYLGNENGIFPDVEKTHSCGPREDDFWYSESAEWRFKDVSGDKGKKAMEEFADFLSLPSGEARDDFIKYLSEKPENTDHQIAPLQVVTKDDTKVTYQNEEVKQGSLRCQYGNHFQSEYLHYRGHLQPIDVSIYKSEDPEKILDPLFMGLKNGSICPHAPRRIGHSIGGWESKSVRIFSNGRACEEEIFNHLFRDHLTESKM